MSKQTPEPDPPCHVGKEMGCNGNTFGYSVEARYAGHQPIDIGGVLLDNRWRTMHPVKGRPGVPVGSAHHVHVLELAGLVDYAASQALRWWLHAEVEAKHAFSCLETRIVKHKIEYSVRYTALSAHDLIGAEDRSNIMPDWGARAGADKEDG